MAVDTSALRTALAKDVGFIGRLQSLFSTIAVQVLAENSGPNLVARQAYAKKVLNNPQQEASKSASYIITTDNFVGQVITITPLGSVFSVSIATADADAVSQIFTVWDRLASLFG